MPAMSRERVCALILAATALLYCYGTYRMPEFEYVQTTPGKYYTYGLGTSLMVLSLLLFWKTPQAGRKWQPSAARLKRLGAVAGILFLMLPIFRFFGLVVTFTVGCTAISRLLGWKSWVKALFLFGIINLSLFLLFTKLLDIYLPPGDLPEFVLEWVSGEASP